MTTTTYTGDFTNDFINPERGFMIQMGLGEDFSPTNLASIKARNISIIWFEITLSDFVTTPLSQPFLDYFQSVMDKLRTARLKTILRFRYSTSAPTDAAMSVITGQMDQLQPYFMANGDIILILQAGWVGQWGEFQGSNNFGTTAILTDLTPQNLADRKVIIDKCLAVMPKDRFVTTPQPFWKRQLYRVDPITQAESYNQSDFSRLGHSNDCFLEGPSNGGAYIAPTDRTFMSNDTQYVPSAGETCNVITGYTECPAALSDLATMHWSFLNAEYNMDVLNSWTAGGCMPQIQQRLGYRLYIDSFTPPDTITPGSFARFQISMNNVGFAAAYWRNRCNIVLRNGATVVRLPMAARPRDWMAVGTPTLIDESLAIPSNLAAGTYEILFEIPDARLSLAGMPEYSIRLANADTTAWEPTTGLNKLGRTLTVGAPIANLRKKTQPTALF